MAVWVLLRKPVSPWYDIFLESTGSKQQLILRIPRYQSVDCRIRICNFFCKAVRPHTANVQAPGPQNANQKPNCSWMKCCLGKKKDISRWWQLKDFLFSPQNGGRFPFWLIYFSNGLKPPTRDIFFAGDRRWQNLFPLTSLSLSLPYCELYRCNVHACACYIGAYL